MNMKTFEAGSIRDAIKLVKSEFGKDAVILETTEKRDSVSNRMIYQVTASAPNSARKSASANPGYSETVNDYIFELQKQITSLNRTVGQLAKDVVSKKDILHMEKIVEEVKYLYLNNEKSSDFSDIENEAITSIVNQLKLMDVDDTVINQLTSSLLKLELSKDTEKAKTSCLSESVNWFLKRIKIAPKLMSQDKREIHCFVGPTGAGKHLRLQN